MTIFTRGCQPGYRCVGGELIPCPPGTRGGDQGEYCLDCPAGTYQEQEAQTECDSCPYGSYCGVGTASPRACPDGTFGGLPVGLRTRLSHRDNCTACGQGHWCSAGNRYTCNEEFYNEATNATKPSACTRCRREGRDGGTFAC